MLRFIVLGHPLDTPSRRGCGSEREAVVELGSIARKDGFSQFADLTMDDEARDLSASDEIAS